ncbi:MAG: DUF1615 family protein [Deltaproteobacteria bacterium]|nr:DUF1615 family protein [Deltaproteobacteria bacterium]
MILLLLACRSPDPGLSIEDITRVVQDDDDARSWAIDVRDALLEAKQPVDRDHVCQVLAIIEQESGYEADPAVPGLAAAVEKEIDASLKKLGPLANVGKDTLLGPYADRLREVKTERDVDLLFREIVAHHEARAPALARLARFIFPRLIERNNPIATAGSMQVSVAWAQDQGNLDAETVRDLLYTQRGGVRYGTGRLFAHEAGYDRPVYRFADYNAGLYASRNAAFQVRLADLVRVDLVPDGDLLMYDERGRPRSEDGETLRAILAWRLLHAPDLSESRVRSDARKEKEAAFERTELWTRTRGDGPYAQVPDVALISPKMAAGRTTRWFAERVDRRYRECLAR